MPVQVRLDESGFCAGSRVEHYCRAVDSLRYRGTRISFFRVRHAWKSALALQGKEGPDAFGRTCLPQRDPDSRRSHHCRRRARGYACFELRAAARGNRNQFNQKTAKGVEGAGLMM